MLKLHGAISNRWNAEPFVVRLTDDASLPQSLRVSEAFIADSYPSIPSELAGFQCYISRENGPLQTLEQGKPGHITLPAELSYLTPGDIIRVTPRTGKVSVLYRIHSNYNVIFMTERCNSNCLMCSQPPRAVDDSHLIEDYLKAIPWMSQETVELGITGGEPTLLKDKFLEIVRTCGVCLPNTALHTLSNGRMLAYLQYAKDLAEIQHPDLMIGIPLYSDIASMHDLVVQAKGAFDQTIRGILNLARVQVRVEIRVVVHQQTYHRLPQLARFIARNLPFVSHVTFMGLEMMGHTRANLPLLWVDPVDYQNQLEEAVLFLDRQRINVSVYNHQLCVLRKSLWAFAKQSISDWKNEYFPACEACAVKNQCGGFFSSAPLKFSDHIHPIPAGVS